MDENDANQKLNLLVKAIEADVERNDNKFFKPTISFAVKKEKLDEDEEEKNLNKSINTGDRDKETNNVNSVKKNCSYIDENDVDDDNNDEDDESNLDDSNSNMSNSVSTTSADEGLVNIRDQQKPTLLQTNEQKLAFILSKLTNSSNNFVQNYDLLKQKLAAPAIAMTGNINNNSVPQTNTNTIDNVSILNGFPLFIGKNGKPTRPFKAYPKEPLSMPLGCTPAFNLPFQLNCNNNIINNKPNTPPPKTASPENNTQNNNNNNTNVENILAMLGTNNNYDLAGTLNSFDFNSKFHKRIQQAKSRVEVKSRLKNNKHKKKLKDLDDQIMQQEQEEEQEHQQHQQREKDEIENFNKQKLQLELQIKQQEFLNQLINHSNSISIPNAAILIENSKLKLNQNDEIIKINDKFQPIITLNPDLHVCLNENNNNNNNNFNNISEHGTTLIPPPKKRHRAHHQQLMENMEQDENLRKLQQEQEQPPLSQPQQHQQLLIIQPKLNSLAEIMTLQYQQPSSVSSSSSSSSSSTSTPSSPSLVCSTPSSLSLSSCSSVSSTFDENCKEDTYKERRRKNNEAAKRSRDARRAKEDEIALRAALLERENLQLKVEVAQLKQETSNLRCMLYNS